MNAKRRVKYLQEILAQVGLGRERLEMFNISSSEGPRFAQIARDMTERIKKMGPRKAKILKEQVG